MYKLCKTEQSTARQRELERELLELRYVHQLGQRETAGRLGVSQMQVSRLERRILGRLQTLATAGSV